MKYRLQTCALFLLLVLLSACALAPADHGKRLSGRISWTGEVRLRGDIVLAEDAVLVIAPGTTVLFDPPAPGEDTFREHPYFPGSELIVRGRLFALGTAEKPIVFRSSDPAAPAGSWGGLNIEESPEAHFDHVRFLQADSAVHSRQSWVTIEHSVFRDNLVGVRFHDTDLLLENNLFEKNDTAIRFHFGAPVICNNLVRNNRKGIFISSAPRDYHIENNAFLANHPYQVSLGEGVRETVNLRNNYWGELTPAALEELFFDGRIDDWLGRVAYQPRLSSPPSLDLPQ